MFGAGFALLTAVDETDGTGMSRDSLWDQFVCRMWLTRVPLWSVLVTSTYGILLTALERYVAVIYPVSYKVYTVVRVLTWHYMARNNYIKSSELIGRTCHMNLHVGLIGRPNRLQPVSYTHLTLPTILRV